MDIYQFMIYTNKWKVEYSKSVEKTAVRLTENVLLRLRFLIHDLENKGPSQPDWPNYSKLKGQKTDKRHCHLQRGKPTYVCCWEVVDKKQKLIEVYYVGTHEKAPY
jgi:mRNA-degrading endonuclease YafQ of YafQ-DinJ toxin-antitoxin module